MSSDTFSVYEIVWRKAQQEGAWVHYYGYPDDGMTSGFFDPRQEPAPPLTPEIAIFRPWAKDPEETPDRESDAPIPWAQPDLLAELITLAHEYGHLMSWKNETPRSEWKKYQAIAKRRGEIMSCVGRELSDGAPRLEFSHRVRAALLEAFSDDDRRRIVEEETRAWSIGRTLLREIGFVHFDAFDKRREDGLHHHRHVLGIDDVWPTDLQP